MSNEKKTRQAMIKAAGLVIKGVLKKQAACIENLSARVAELEIIAAEHAYNKKIAALAENMVSARIIAADEKYTTMDELRSKYASAEAVPDPALVVDVFNKTAGAFGQVQDQAVPADPKSKFMSYLLSK